MVDTEVLEKIRNEQNIERIQELLPGFIVMINGIIAEMKMCNNINECSRQFHALDNAQRVLVKISINTSIEFNDNIKAFIFDLDRIDIVENKAVVLEKIKKGIYNLN